MKKSILLFLIVFSLQIHAQESDEGYYIALSIIDPGSANGPRPRSPIIRPLLYVEDHTISWDEIFSFEDISILDEDSNVVYYVNVSSNTFSIQVPNYIEGEYIIQVELGDKLYVGEIEL